MSRRETIRSLAAVVTGTDSVPWLDRPPNDKIEGPNVRYTLGCKIELRRDAPRDA